jgi:signal transduction histidine kinase
MTFSLTILERTLDAMPGRHLLIKADSPKFTIVYAGKNYLEMVGRSLESIVDRGVFEVFQPTHDESGAESATTLKESFNLVISEGKVNLLPAQRYDLDDEESKIFHAKFWRIRNSPVVNDDGEVDYILNSVEDITYDVFQRRREEELKPMRKSHNLYIQAPLAIQIFTGPELIIELANDLTLNMWGRGPEVIGKPLLEALPELKGHGYELLMQEVIETGISKSFYERPIELNRGGKMEKAWFNFIYQPYFEDNVDKPVGVLVFSDEVTDRILARQLTETNRALTEKNKELEQFAYVASHDLQEPLRKITFFIRMLEESLGEVDVQSKHFIDKILSSSSRMSDLIRDILDFSRVSIMEDEFKRVDLNQTMEEIIADFDIDSTEINVRIKVGPLPVIMAIPFQIHQFFHNLLSNALKFTRNDTDLIISIRSHKVTEEVINDRPGLMPNQEYYMITIEDNGIGFDELHAERIFGIFQRLHSKLEYDGTGIGLALCRKIALNHQGDIWANSVEGKGSIFKVILPVKIILD